MKKIGFIIIIITIIVGCSKTVNTDEVVFNKEIRKVVLKNSGNKPFTGKVLHHNKEGILQLELQFKNGINITENLRLSMNSLCDTRKAPFEYSWDLELDTLGIFMKDFFAPFSGVFVINSKTDSLYDDIDIDFAFESSYKSGFKNGIAKYYRNEILLSEINYKNNKYNGMAIEYYESGELRNKSNFRNGKLNGTSLSYHKNGNIEVEVNYNDGIITDNEVTEYFDNGIVKSITQYKEGIIDGSKQEFYLNEKTKYKIDYVKGKINGKWMYWKKDGELLDSGELIDGTGIIKHYFDNYNLKNEANYKNDKFNGIAAEYTENGNLKKKESFIDGIKNGDFIEYFENGQLKEKSFFKNGNLDGKKIIYFENGKIKEKTDFSDGMKNGWQFNYDENGKLKYNFYFVNDNYEYREYKKNNPKLKKYITFVKAKLERFEKDYDRNSKPYSAHVRAYFQFKNISNKTITAIKFDFAFKDVFGDILYDNSAKYDLNLPSGEKNPMNLYWYWEDSYSSPYKKLWSPVESGNVKTEVSITKIVFSDGSIIE